MDRVSMTNAIGNEWHTSNIEGGEYSYVAAAGSKEKLEALLGHPYKHFKLDIRFQKGDVAVLVETKQNFVKDDEAQLEEYLEEERVVNKTKKIICILANTNNNKMKVWQSAMDDEHFLKDETIFNEMEHYVKLFDINKSNDRERVLKNTYKLNEMLHKKDIDEKLRSQFVGTILLHIKKLIREWGITYISNETVSRMNDYLNAMTSEKSIRSEIENTLGDLLDGSDNKAKKIELLQKNVLGDQKVKKLTKKEWEEIFDTILTDIYRYIDTESSEGQDILNLFFIAFNKYTGKADKNQAFTPDHITDFMCRLTEVDCRKRVLDATCGSGSFLVQAMVKELADARRGRTDKEAEQMMKKVRLENIYGIEVEEKAYGLSTTNMLIHGDGNSNVRQSSCFDQAQWIKDAHINIVLMNPPYNAQKVHCLPEYTKTWKSDTTTDPSKGFHYVYWIARQVKTGKMAVLLPMACAIGGKNKEICKFKELMLEDNTLDAVFSLPADIFHPGAMASACCMVFNLGTRHKNSTTDTFFGYFKDDGFKKKKNFGRVEKVDSEGNGLWANIEKTWLELYRNRETRKGLSVTKKVTAKDEWLAEAYMETDFTKLCEKDFQNTVNTYYSFLVKVGN